MTETRTPKQIAADKVRRALTAAAAEAFDFALAFDEPAMREAGHQIAALRTRVRAHMHPRDREEQNDG